MPKFKYLWLALGKKSLVSNVLSPVSELWGDCFPLTSQRIHATLE